MMARGLDLTSSTGRLIAEESVVISYVMAFVFGIPIYLVRQRYGWTSWLAYLGGAFVMGSVATPLVGFEFILWRTHNLDAVIRAAVYPGLYPGALAIGVLAMPIGLLFWHIVRPDRTSLQDEQGRLQLRAEIARLPKVHPHLSVPIDEVYADFGGKSTVPLIAAAFGHTRNRTLPRDVSQSD
jgi:hypothetical protein